MSIAENVAHIQRRVSLKIRVFMEDAMAKSSEWHMGGAGRYSLGLFLKRGELNLKKIITSRRDNQRRDHQGGIIGRRSQTGTNEQVAVGLRRTHGRRGLY